MKNFTDKEMRIILVACTVIIGISAAAFKIGLGILVNIIR